MFKSQQNKNEKPQEALWMLPSRESPEGRQPGARAWETCSSQLRFIFQS
jgi:hypothetical protein